MGWTLIEHRPAGDGLGWKCRAEVAGFPCHYMNVGTASCGGCGAEESEGKEEPDG